MNNEGFNVSDKFDVYNTDSRWFLVTRGDLEQLVSMAYLLGAEENGGIPDLGCVRDLLNDAICDSVCAPLDGADRHKIALTFKDVLDLMNEFLNSKGEI